MRFLLASCLFICLTVTAQVPNPQSTTQNTPDGPYWKKSGSVDYTLYNSDGEQITNTKDLKYLSTDTLGVLDRNRRDVYLLADFKNAAEGAVGKAVILARNVAKNFYITNPYSFAHFENDVYLEGIFSNINGNYVYYLSGSGKTYLLEDIRSYTGWGSRSSKELPYSANSTYWYRDADRGEYGVIKEGKTLDYSIVVSEKDGNDLLIKVSGVYTYRLPGYYTMSSFVFKPVEMYSGGSSSTTSSSAKGCVSGDCQNGWGRYEYDNGYYDGFWKNGKKDGYGMYKWPETGKYIGSWINDQMEGYGVYIADNNDNIIGQYKNGQLNGLGITVTGDKWEQGIFTNGGLVTKYDFYSTANDSGCTAGDCIDKYGRYKWSNGDSFTGFFKNGKMLMGTYTFASGDKYSGMFNSNNQFEGMGRFFFKGGEYYGGQWRNGKYFGRGYYHDKDLVQKIGEWSEGTLVKSMK